MSNYKFQKDIFTIKDFDKQKTFSSFLPGIAGLKGIPIWSFYCNRGQAISSFGIESKDYPIMEFFPANTSYQYNSTYGFRSFIKINNKVYEPFGIKRDANIQRNMYVEYSQVKIEEINKNLGLKYTVTYFVIPNENFGALGRYVNIENISEEKLEIELLDGQCVLLPFGVTNSTYKEMSNLVCSWMDVDYINEKIPFFKLRSSTEDTAQVSDIVAGNFYLTFDDNENILNTIVDSKVIFDYDKTFSSPLGFESNTLEDILLKEQVKVNKTPCAFTATSFKLNANETYNVNTIIGKSHDLNSLKDKYIDIINKNYLIKKANESKEIINDILKNVETQTNNELFDSYIKQCYLDNLLRGGYPLVFGKDDKKKVHYVYSRKHGDPERDYNFFKLAPEFYSQGNGNFRDVNQNRRSDILINPEIKDINIKLFYSLIQLDGYNPLEVQGFTYTIDKKSIDILKNNFSFFNNDLENILKSKFSIGIVSKMLTILNVSTDEENKFLDTLLSMSSQHIEARFGEGYWSDHFSYNQDLLDNYLAVYPDKEKHILFIDKSFKIYESCDIVVSRKNKYTVDSKNEVKQFDSVQFDKERESVLGLNKEETNWLRDKNGNVYETNLFEKMLILVVQKFLSLDPSGIGVEMESNKPGWNDAMNGLPGLIGSGVSETLELQRVLKYLSKSILKYKDEVEEVILLEEFATLLEKFTDLQNVEDSHKSWDLRSKLKEEYRDNVRLLQDTSVKTVELEMIEQHITYMIDIIDKGIEKANDFGKGIIPTFLYHKPVEYVNNDGEVTVKSFELLKLPNFLEGPARYLKLEKDKSKALDLYNNIIKTDIYDEKLGMYKTSGSLENCGFEIGRIRGFTAGWLERESIFLHMTYKYMLGLLKAGLFEEFYKEIETNFVCFRNPEEYGRSPIENSSFIVPTINPDNSMHGQGMVARLSGSTAEMLTMWNIMMTGGKCFTYNKKLSFILNPLLKKDLFKNNKLSFNLFSTINVTYINESDKDTFDENVTVYKYIVDGEEINSSSITGDLALKIRNREVTSIIAYLK